MKKQTIHDFTHDDKQAALDEANEIMNPSKKLVEIEKYVNDSFAKSVSPILREHELNLLIYLANKGLGDSK